MFLLTDKGKYMGKVMVKGYQLFTSLPEATSFFFLSTTW